MSINMEAFAQFREGVNKLPEMVPPAPQRADADRVRAFEETIIKSIRPHQAMDLETCVHCGMCAEACHYYVSTQDANLRPFTNSPRCAVCISASWGPIVGCTSC